VYSKDERRFMKSRWLSTFTLIGILLLLIGIAGLILQHTVGGFVFDPGQPPPTDDGQDRTPWYYLAIGALMVLNGLVNPVPTPAEKTDQRSSTGVAHPSASASRPRSSQNREAIVTSADQTSE
jgi:hypothetical protein